MLRFVVPAVLTLAAALSAQTPFFPLKDLKPGMRGTGRTVFSGSRIDEFQVEILGVLENVGPKESLILARLSGGPLEHTGVMQGMSGSPVYIDGELVGAVAMAFPYAKDPIAGIRPIEDMVRSSSIAASPPQRPLIALADRDLTRALPRPQPALTGPGPERLIDIATPVSFGGFTRATLEAFAPQLRTLGLEPRQGITGGGSIEPGMGNPADLKPGSMISVQLMAGDYSVGADGTVTYIDGNRVYAFGHRFLDVGATDLPFARADVITLLPSLNTSFKLSTAREWMGAISHDNNTAVTGEIGKRAAMVPISIAVSHGSRAVQSYQLRIVNDPLLSPLLVQMAVYSVIDETERTVGVSSIRVSGEIEFQNAPAPVLLNNMFAADTGSAAQVSLSAAIPVAYVMQSSFDSLQLKKVALDIQAYDQKKQLTIDSVSVSRREVRAGEKLRLNVLLTGENGVETARQFDYDVPIGAEPGTLYFTVADAGATNLADFRQVLTVNPRSPAQLITTVNNLHPNTKAYVRVWRADPAYQLEGVDLPDPPASVALILAGTQASHSGITQTRNAKLAEMEVDGGDMVISGVKTVQVEIRE
ncbi:MAG TPA: SpoIVB peptidase S55 domain-containing protein [Bryobacteraceae bacterium]|nr:SpoIVB peptidase S55 domain-containing protein [Bryobacteraceae bacterium]